VEEADAEAVEPGVGGVLTGPQAASGELHADAGIPCATGLWRDAIRLAREALRVALEARAPEAVAGHEDDAEVGLARRLLVGPHDVGVEAHPSEYIDDVRRGRLQPLWSCVGENDLPRRRPGRRFGGIADGIGREI